MKKKRGHSPAAHGSSTSPFPYSVLQYLSSKQLARTLRQIVLFMHLLNILLGWLLKLGQKNNSKHSQNLLQCLISIYPVPEKQCKQYMLLAEENTKPHERTSEGLTHQQAGQATYCHKGILLLYSQANLKFLSHWVMYKHAPKGLQQRTQTHIQMS